MTFLSLSPQVCHTKADYDEHGASICRHNPVFGTMTWSSFSADRSTKTLLRAEREAHSCSVQIVMHDSMIETFISRLFDAVFPSLKKMRYP